MLIFAPKSLKCRDLHDLIYVFLDNGVLTTPKRRILSFVFTVLCFKESLLIRKFYFSVCESPIQSIIIERGNLQGCHFPGEEQLETSSGYSPVGHFVSCVLHGLALL